MWSYLQNLVKYTCSMSTSLHNWGPKKLWFLFICSVFQEEEKCGEVSFTTGFLTVVFVYSLTSKYGHMYLCMYITPLPPHTHMHLWCIYCDALARAPELIYWFAVFFLHISLFCWRLGEWSLRENGGSKFFPSTENRCKKAHSFSFSF